MKKIIFSILLILLLAAVCFQIFGEASKRARMIAPTVADLLPKEISGWTVTDQPIADSPDMLKTVEDVLHYDSAVFRIYKKGDVEIAVYLAYWRPGKVDPALLDAHTPDICWVDNGWKDSILPVLPPQIIGDISVPIPNHRRFISAG